MAFNADFYDVEKYYLKWLRVLDNVERTWFQVLCMSFVCYLIDYYFNNNKMFDHNIILDL